MANDHHSLTVKHRCKLGQTVFMLLHLDPHTRIRQLNRLLALQFPFLKLEFYHYKSKMQPLVKMPEQATLAEVNPAFSPGKLTISAHDTVADVEHRFSAHHQLEAQVLRKSGDVWLLTTHTDNLEIEQQNHMGSAASRPFRTNWNALFL